MRTPLLVLVGGMLIVLFLGACSAGPRTSDRSSSSDEVLWLDAPPQCPFTEVTQLSGQYRNVSTLRSDRLSRLRAMMVEKAREQGGDAVVKESITPVSGKDGVFTYEGRVIQFEEPDCRT
jgi:hypothetical protein